MKENSAKIRERVLSLIDSEFESDAAFEREMQLPEKTVSNWRRGKSSSFIAILPLLSEKYGLNLGEFYDMPIRSDSSELSEEELEILSLYRKARVLPKKMRLALKETIEHTINMYITAGSSSARKNKQDRA